MSRRTTGSYTVEGAAGSTEGNYIGSNRAAALFLRLFCKLLHYLFVHATPLCVAVAVVSVYPTTTSGCRGFHCGLSFHPRLLLVVCVTGGGMALFRSPFRIPPPMLARSRPRFQSTKSSRGCRPSTPSSLAAAHCGWPLGASEVAPHVFVGCKMCVWVQRCRSPAADQPRIARGAEPSSGCHRGAVRRVESSSSLATAKRTTAAVACARRE